MAYVSVEKKAKIAAALAPVLKKYNLKGSLKGAGSSSITLTLKSGSIDFIGNGNKTCSESFYQVSRGFTANTSGHEQVNLYWIQDHYSGKALEAMQAIKKALMAGDYYDRSDAMTDYFDTAYYFHCNIGSWNKPYAVTA